MDAVWIFTLGSVLVVSLISLVGVFTFGTKPKALKRMLIYMVSFSAGALFGDAFIHLLPEASETGFTSGVALGVIAGISASFVLEKGIRWRHCHMPITKGHVHTFALMNLAGDAVHNFIDGLTIGASYLTSVPVGIATTMAVVFHEIPQEIGDFGVLVHGGFSRQKALLYNFLIALTAMLGALVVLAIGNYTQGFQGFAAALIPFAAGNFIYIAGSDLIPELHKDVEIRNAAFQLAAFAAGVGVMLALRMLE